MSAVVMLRCPHGKPTRVCTDCRHVDLPIPCTEPVPVSQDELLDRLERDMQLAIDALSEASRAEVHLGACLARACGNDFFVRWPHTTPSSQVINDLGSERYLLWQAWAHLERARNIARKI